MAARRRRAVDRATVIQVRCRVTLDRSGVVRHGRRLEIESITHKALRRFAETGSPKGLDAQTVDRLIGMLAFLADAGSVDTLKLPPNFGAHELKGDRAGTWSLTVTRNWRMTFRLNEAGAIIDLDLEDYH